MGTEATAGNGTGPLVVGGDGELDAAVVWLATVALPVALERHNLPGVARLLREVPVEQLVPDLLMGVLWEAGQSADHAAFVQRGRVYDGTLVEADALVEVTGGVELLVARWRRWHRGVHYTGQHQLPMGAVVARDLVAQELAERARVTATLLAGTRESVVCRLLAAEVPLSRAQATADVAVGGTPGGDA